VAEKLGKSTNRQTDYKTTVIRGYIWRKVGGTHVSRPYRCLLLCLLLLSNSPRQFAAPLILSAATNCHGVKVKRKQQPVSTLCASCCRFTPRNRGDIALKAQPIDR